LHYWSFSPVIIDNSQHTHIHQPSVLATKTQGEIVHRESILEKTQSKEKKNEDFSATKIAAVAAIVIGLIISIVVLTKLVVNYIRWQKQQQRAHDIGNIVVINDPRVMSERTKQLILSLQDLTRACDAVEKDHLSIHRIVSIASAAMIIIGLVIALFGIGYAVMPLLIAGLVVGGIGLTAGLANWVISPSAPDEEALREISYTYAQANEIFAQWNLVAKVNLSNPGTLPPFNPNIYTEQNLSDQIVSSLAIPQHVTQDEERLYPNPYYAVRVNAPGEDSSQRYMYCSYRPSPSAPPMD
jgi:cytochrome c oxidase assembly protein Cox11